MIKKEEEKLSKMLSFEYDQTGEDSMQCNETIEDISMSKINNAARQNTCTCRCNRQCSKLQASQGKEEVINKLCKQIVRVRKASGQVGQIINIFVMKYFDPQMQDLPLQKNLDKLTLKFIFNSDMCHSCYRRICQEIIAQRKQLNEIQQIKLILEMYEEQDGDQDSFEAEVEYEQQKTEQYEDQNEGMSSSRQRNRRKRGMEQFESDYESIYRRVSDLVVKERERLQCKV